MYIFGKDSAPVVWAPEEAHAKTPANDGVCFITPGVEGRKDQGLLDNLTPSAVSCKADSTLAQIRHLHHLTKQCLGEKGYFALLMLPRFRVRVEVYAGLLNFVENAQPWF